MSNLVDGVSPRDIERPPNPEHGDLAFPVMGVADGRNPCGLAEELAEEFPETDLVDSVDVAGPGYLNFHLSFSELLDRVEEQLRSDGMGVGQRDGKVLVEFSSPNLAKPMHIGHLRNNCLGDSLHRILDFAGYNAFSENYLGDWGTKHGQVIYAYRQFGSREELMQNPMEHMYDLYVRINREADEETQEKAREWSRRIEEGDEEATRLWEMFREFTLDHDMEDYQRMDIRFDRITGESKVAEEAEEMLREGLEKGYLEEDDDGSIYAEFEDLPDVVLKRSDGSTLYLARDLANIKKRELEQFDRNLYVVANEQDLHFKQLFRLAERFGIGEEMESRHVSYGYLNIEGEESMSSSKGNIITMREVLDRAEEKAERIEDREIDASEAVGLAAVKYGSLSVSRSKGIEFSWDRALSFEGESGPYLQYSNTRARSILVEADESGENLGTLTEHEKRLVRELAAFPGAVDSSVESLDPVKLASYLSELCEAFNQFYHECPVLQADQKDTRRRLLLVELFREVTDTGLELLGIETLDEM
jgi:arginyl-tRNA synthetase